MMRSRFTPRDQNGNARRFAGHGEALWWVFTRIGGLFGIFLAVLFYQTLRTLFDDTATDIEKLSATTVGVGLFIGIFIVCVLVYGYIALAGGIISRKERGRIEQNR